MPTSPLDPHQLADDIEAYAAMIVSALRNQGNESGSAADAPKTHEGDERGDPTPPEPGASHYWKPSGEIEGFDTKWAAPPWWKAQGHKELHEHYGPMRVYEADDGKGVIRIAIGEPSERLLFYGKERGWLSAWEVANGRPVRQLAVFVEVDDFETTGERAALISGKDGAAKKGFAPNERHLLPPAYVGMRIEVQRDRIVGPYSRNRLVVVARADEIDTMLNHALAHLRLRG